MFGSNFRIPYTCKLQRLSVFGMRRSQANGAPCPQAAIVATADPFHLRMMKLTTNSAQDNAGFTAHVRSSLSHWTSYRWQWTENQRERPTRPDRLAPVQEALGDNVLSWSRMAKYMQCTTLIGWPLKSNRQNMLLHSGCNGFRNSCYTMG